MKRLACIFLALFALTSAASAQGVGKLQPGNVWGNPTGSAAYATSASISAIIDQQFTCSARGSIIERGAGAWSCFAPGTTGKLLMAQGAAADPIWSAITYPTTANSGGVACFTSSTGMVSSVLQTANALILGGGAGVCPSPLGSLGTTTTILHGNAAGAPTFGSVVYGDVASGSLATQSNFFAATASTLVPTSIIYTTETTTTYGATTTFDFNTFINTAVTLTGNITTMTLSNVKAGQSGQIRFIQDGTGSRTTVWSSTFKFAGGLTPTLTTTAAAVDALEYTCTATNYCVASLISNVK